MSTKFFSENLFGQRLLVKEKPLCSLSKIPLMTTSQCFGIVNTRLAVGAFGIATWRILLRVPVQRELDNDRFFSDYGLLSFWFPLCVFET